MHFTAVECQRCLLCDSQDPGMQKAQLAAQRDVPLEDMGSVGSAGTDRVSTPFSLSQVGMEPSRSFQELHGGSAPSFLSARWGKRLPGASRSLADQSIPVPPLRRSWTRILLLSTIPTDRGDQSYPASDSAGCRGNSEWLHSSQTKLSRNESGVVRDELVIYAPGEQSQCREEVGRRFPFPQ